MTTNLIALAALLKAGSLPKKQATMGVIYLLNPPLLGGALARQGKHVEVGQWKEMVPRGKYFNSSPVGSDHEWGAAILFLRANRYLIEENTSEGTTWSPSRHIGNIDTAPVDACAAFVLKAMALFQEQQPLWRAA